MATGNEPFETRDIKLGRLRLQFVTVTDRRYWTPHTEYHELNAGIGRPTPNVTS